MELLMMNKLVFHLLPVILFAASSCRPKFVEITPFPYDPVLVANAFIEAGKPWEMHLSRTASFYENSGNLRLTDSANAIVTSDAGTVILEWEKGLTNAYRSDSLLPQVGVEYSLSVTSADYPAVEASMKIPPPGLIISAVLTDSVAIDARGDWVARLRIQFQDPEPDQQNYFLFTLTAIDTLSGSIAGIEFQSEDPIIQFSSAISKISRNPQNQEIKTAYFFLDEWFEADTYTLDLFPASSRLSSLAAFRQVWRIEFLTLDSNMYQYYESLYRQEKAYVSPHAEPVPVKTNIRGGFGIWGGFSKDTLRKGW